MSKVQKPILAVMNFIFFTTILTTSISTLPEEFHFLLLAKSHPFSDLSEPQSFLEFVRKIKFNRKWLFAKVVGIERISDRVDESESYHRGYYLRRSNG